MVINALKKTGIRVSSLDEHIHIVQGEGRSRSPFSNSILILDKRNTLVDTGCGLKTIVGILKILPLHLIISTHSHPDHTAGNWLIQERSEAEIVVPSNNSDTIGNADRLAVRLIGEELAPLWKETYLPITGFRDFLPHAYYGDGYIFPLGNTRFIALHTPGHLNDHYCLYEPQRKILIGSDIDLSPFGPWYGNEESDIYKLKSSIERLKAMHIEVYISSHAKAVRGGYIKRRLNAYANVFAERDKTILHVIPSHAWVSQEDIVLQSPIYGYDYDHMDRILHYGETQMVKKHLGDLVQKGAVMREKIGYKKRI
jgi:glyoxylase-like metal-dependent hydrolase (beta-lactamase superfamily II)